VSAVAMMHLVQTGKLSLDRDINEYLKTWKLPGNELTQRAKVTLRGLLSHSAGVTVSGFPGYEAGTPLPSVAQVLNGEAPANNQPIRVDMVPGTAVRYSGGGYTIAQFAATEVAGTPFAKLVHDTVLRPFGMRHSTFGQPLTPRLLPQAATPYRENGSPVPGGPHVYPELAAAGLWTTPSDLARFVIGIQKALSGKSDRVLSARTAQAMLQPVLEDRSIGFVVDERVKSFRHGGGNAGYRCALISFQNGDGAVIMANSDSGWTLITELTRAIAHEYAWPDFAPAGRVLNAVDPKSFDRYAGAYRQQDGSVVTFWRDGAQVRVHEWGEPVRDFFPTSETEYFARTIATRVTFAGTGDTADTTAIIHLRDDQRHLNRLPDDDARAALEWSQNTEKRIREQTATPGSEAALRTLIAGLAAGRPSYETMSPAFANQQLPFLQAAARGFGDLHALAFMSVAPDGSDIYEAKLANGTYEFRLLMLRDGRIDRAGFNEL
jgi:hypothetical protein